MSLLAFVVLGGCKEAAEKSPIPLPDRPDVSLPIPKSPEGAYELLKVAGSKLELDPTRSDPLTALGRCADLVTGCYEGGGSLDACVNDANACGTDEPWKEDACCPAACKSAYETVRGSGTAPLEAFEHVYFVDTTCFPGVTALVGGAP